MLEQQRKAEGMAFVQTAAQLAPLAAAAGIPMNMKAYVDEWLKSQGVEDVERFWSAMPQPAVPGAAGGASGETGEMMAPEGPGGVTSPLATDPSVSPSAPISQAPVQFMQRALAMTGGPANL
jgi:hypothetical protein